MIAEGTHSASQSPRDHVLKRLLVATDGLPSGDRAVSLATVLALRHGAEIEICYAVDRVAALGESCVGYSSGETIVPFLDSLDESATNIVRKALNRVRHAGVVATANILDGGPVSSIVGRERSRPFDALVMGTQGRHGLQRFLMGSVADSVLRSTSIPVFVVKPTLDVAGIRFERTLVAIDDSLASSLAIEFALDFAASEKTDLIFCNVAAPGAQLPTELLGAPAARAQKRGIPCEAVAVRGDPGNQILTTAAARDVDFIILGTHGRGGLSRWFFGSVAECVVEYSQVPVVVVRGVS